MRRARHWMFGPFLLLAAGCGWDGPASLAVAPPSAPGSVPEVPYEEITLEQADDLSLDAEPTPVVAAPPNAETPASTSTPAASSISTMQPAVAASTTSSSSSTSTTSTTLPRRLPPADVAVVGDSLTLSAQAEITRTLTRLGVGSVVVDGQESRRMTRSTETVRSGLDVVAEFLAVSTPKVWVIALGTNDVASGSSSGVIRRSVQSILAAIPADAYVVWIDTWIRDRYDAVVAGNQVIRDTVLARPHSVVADFFAYGDDDGVIANDGVHLTRRGRQLFADVMSTGIATAVAGLDDSVFITPDTTTTSTTTTTTSTTTSTTTTLAPDTTTTLAPDTTTV
jgi:lysophospholipase L1-like esterase